MNSKVEPLISIVMPAFNAEKTIGSSIGSILNQDYSNWELLVVNDGSTDGTHDILNAYQDSRIKIFSIPNSGVAAARNHALHHSSGDFIAFLDSDDLWDKLKLQSQIDYFQNCPPNVGLVYTFARRFNDGGNYSFRMNSHANFFRNNDYFNLLILDFIPTLTVMLRAEVVYNIGFFDEDLRGTEDWDFWIRVSRIYAIRCIKIDLAYYRILGNSLSSNKERHSLEEYKAISKSLALDPSLPASVKSLSISFWKLKLIYNYLKFKDYGKISYLLLDIKRFKIKDILKLFIWSIRHISFRLMNKYLLRKKFSCNNY